MLQSQAVLTLINATNYYDILTNDSFDIMNSEMESYTADWWVMEGQNTRFLVREDGHDVGLTSGHGVLEVDPKHRVVDIQKLAYKGDTPKNYFVDFDVWYENDYVLLTKSTQIEFCNVYESSCQTYETLDLKGTFKDLDYCTHSMVLIREGENSLLLVHCVDTEGVSQVVSYLHGTDGKVRMAAYEIENIYHITLAKAFWRVGETEDEFYMVFFDQLPEIKLREQPNRVHIWHCSLRDNEILIDHTYVNVPLSSDADL